MRGINKYTPKSSLTTGIARVLQPIVILQLSRPEEQVKFNEERNR